jgi:hypothetical protein
VWALPSSGTELPVGVAKPWPISESHVAQPSRCDDVPLALAGLPPQGPLRMDPELPRPPRSPEATGCVFYRVGCQCYRACGAQRCSQCAFGASPSAGLCTRGSSGAVMPFCATAAENKCFSQAQQAAATLEVSPAPSSTGPCRPEVEATLTSHASKGKRAAPSQAEPPGSGRG